VSLDVCVVPATHSRYEPIGLSIRLWRALRISLKPVNRSVAINVLGSAEERMRTAANTRDARRRGHATDALAAGCAVAFVAILGIAAYWDRTIRVLHVFESIPFIVAAVLCLRQRKSGYMLGAASGAFWLWMAGTLTNFVRNGFERVAMLLRTGHVDRLDILIAAPAAAVTGGLVLCSLWGYSRVRNKSWTDLVLFVVATGAVGGFFITIFAAFAPQYLGMFRHLFGK